MSDLIGGRRQPLLGAARFRNNPLTWRLTINELVGWLVIALIVLCSLGLFFFYVEPSSNGGNNLRIGADSAFYLWHAGINRDNPYGANDESTFPAISFGSNYLGPDLIGRLLRNGFLILCFDYFLFFVAIAYIARSISVRALLLTILLLMNPSILVSVLTLNKEILVLLSTAMLCYYLETGRRSRLLLCCLLIVALLGRWQNCLVDGFFLLMTAPWNPLNKRRGVTLAILVLTITIVYPFLWPFINLALGINEYEGKTIAVLTEAQTHFLYFVVVIPKIALNLYGGAIELARAGNDNRDVYNSLIVPLTSLANAIVTVWYCIARKLDLRNDRLFLALVYAIIFAVSPFTQCRYLLPVYLILCIEIARNKSASALSMRILPFRLVWACHRRVL
jgi:hypothetical protein